MVKPPGKYDGLFEAISKMRKGECLKITLDDNAKYFHLALSSYCIKRNKKIRFDLKPLGSNREWLIIKKGRIEEYPIKIAGMAFTDKKYWCSYCKREVKGFNDRLAAKEFRISKMCQKCQDILYKGKV